MTTNQQRAFECWADSDPVAAIAAALDAAEARGPADAWDAGYAAAQLDADDEPYSDRPERATWQPRQNPYRAPASPMTERRACPGGPFHCTCPQPIAPPVSTPLPPGACVICGWNLAAHQGRGEMLHDFVQMDDQCPVTSRRCDQPCDAECNRGKQ